MFQKLDKDLYRKHNIINFIYNIVRRFNVAHHGWNNLIIDEFGSYIERKTSEAKERVKGTS